MKHMDVNASKRRENSHNVVHTTGAVYSWQRNASDQVIYVTTRPFIAFLPLEVNLFVAKRIVDWTYCMQTMQTCQKGNTWAEWEAWSNTDVDLRSFRSFMIILKLKIIHVLIYTIIWFEYRSAYVDHRQF